jgi:ABC-2 type transport system permease protein
VATIVTAKLLLTALWAMGLTLVMFLFGLGIGKAVDIPGWSSGLARTSFAGLLLTAVLTCLLMPLVALFASMGRGYLLPLAWALGTVFLAQIAAVLGWGGYFPWSVPALVSGVLGPPAEQVGLHSYLSVLLAFGLGRWGRSSGGAARISRVSCTRRAPWSENESWGPQPGEQTRTRRASCG